MFATILRSMFSSSARKAAIWEGSVISILASISVFWTSMAASSRAILAFSTFLGMAGWTGSLSMMMPWMNSVSSMEAPVFLTIWMLSMSTFHLSLLFSATAVTACTARSPRPLREPLTDFEIMDVSAMSLRDSASLMSTGVETASSTSWALAAASL